MPSRLSVFIRSVGLFNKRRKHFTLHTIHHRENTLPLRFNLQQPFTYLEAVIMSPLVFFFPRLNKPGPFSFSSWGFPSFSIIGFSKSVFMHLCLSSRFSSTGSHPPHRAVLDLQLGSSAGLRRMKGHLPPCYRLFFHLSMIFDFFCNHIVFWLLFRETSWSPAWYLSLPVSCHLHIQWVRAYCLLQVFHGTRKKFEPPTEPLRFDVRFVQINHSSSIFKYCSSCALASIYYFFRACLQTSVW